MDEIKVSVCMITYNQKDYIQQAIESVLMQKTNFNYEIIIHDDCSNDGTRNILIEYQKKYPNKIKLILQEENQYSKGNNILPFFVPYIEGKYVAINEGDDYWTDESKLQLQYDYMINNVDCSLVLHKAAQINSKDQVMLYVGEDIDKDYSIKDIILGGGSFFATNSMFYKSEVLKSLPPYYFKGTGDYLMAINLADKGKIHYISKNMSVYRYSSSGSWTSKYKSNRDFFLKHTNSMIKILDEINSFYNYKYDKIIKERIEDLRISILMYDGNVIELKRNYPIKYSNMPLKEKLKIHLKGKSPYLYTILERIKNGK